MIMTQARIMKMPMIMYGTAWKEGRTTELVVAAVKAGFTGIDTACQPKHYQQELVGDALSILYTQHDFKRSDLFLQTKFTSIDGQDLAKPMPYDKTAPLVEQVRQSLDTSLKQLQTEYIDCLVLHSPMGSREETALVWNEFQSFVELGKVLQIGISNIYDPVLLEWLFSSSKIKPSVIQNRFRVETTYDKEILALCHKHGARYQSFWTLSANPTLLRSSQLHAVGEGLTPAQALFKFLIQSTKFGRGTIVPLCGTTNEVNMKSTVEVMRLIEAEADREINEAERKLETHIWK